MIYFRHGKKKYSQYIPTMGGLESLFLIIYKNLGRLFGRGFLCIVGFLFRAFLSPILKKGRPTRFIIQRHRCTSSLLLRRALCVGQCGTFILNKGFKHRHTFGFKNLYFELIHRFIYQAVHCENLYIMPSL